jgi:hypothetical protein
VLAHEKGHGVDSAHDVDSTRPMLFDRLRHLEGHAAVNYIRESSQSYSESARSYSQYLRDLQH